MTIIIIVAAVILTVIATIVLIAYGLNQKKIKENVLLGNELITNNLTYFEKEGITSLTKSDEASVMIPKNEIVYGYANLMFEKHKTLKSGTLKKTVEGEGYTVISDKALTVISHRLTSGRKRYLYKNIFDRTPKVERTKFGYSFYFIYNNNKTVVSGSKKDMIEFIKAFHLIKNPIKSSNSISF